MPSSKKTWSLSSPDLGSKQTDYLKRRARSTGKPKIRTTLREEDLVRREDGRVVSKAKSEAGAASMQKLQELGKWAQPFKPT